MKNPRILIRRVEYFNRKIISMKSIIFRKIKLDTAIRKGVSYVAVPVHVSDLDSFNKMKTNSDFKANVSKIRNIKHHKKLFPIINLAVDQGFFDKELLLSDNLILTSDLKEALFIQYKNWKDVFIYISKYKFLPFEKIYLPGHGVQLRVSSISFEKMDQLEYQEFYEKCLDWISDVIGVSKEVLEHERLNYL